jgi:hypothetical protein
MIIGIFILAFAIGDVCSRIGIRLMRLVGGGIHVFVSSVLRFTMLCSGKVLTNLRFLVQTDRGRAVARGLVKVYEACIVIFCFDPRRRSCRARVVPAVHRVTINGSQI